MDLDVDAKRFAFATLDEAVIDSASFLDARLDTDWSSTVAVDAVGLPESADAMREPPIGWIWHTSFCGSTLLARMLHVEPWSVSLREPLILRRLADARDAGIAIDPLLAKAVSLLARTWHPGGRVIVKPTHAALNIAADVMAVQPSARGLLLTSSLEDFLTSHFKKTPETLQRVGALARRALRAAPAFAERLARTASTPPDVLSEAVVQWAAQRELLADLLEGPHGRRLRVLDFSDLLQAPAAVARAAAAWLGPDTVPRHALESRAALAAARHAKAPGRSYGSAARLQETRQLLSYYRGDLMRTLGWAEREVLPTMRASARFPPHPLSTPAAATGAETL